MTNELATFHITVYFRGDGAHFVNHLYLETFQGIPQLYNYIHAVIIKLFK